MTNEQQLNFLLVLLACEQCHLHSSPSNYLASYDSWTARVWALENIIWRFKIRTNLVIRNGNFLSGYEAKTCQLYKTKVDLINEELK